MLERNDIQAVPQCFRCRRFESGKLPMYDFQDTYICADCQTALLPQDNVPAMQPMISSPTAPTDSYYALIGVPITAPPDEIIAALTNAFTLWNGRGSSDEVRDMVEKIGTAYRVLTNPDEKAHYDQTLLETEQQLALTRYVQPIEDFPTRTVNNVKELIAACEATRNNWLIGQEIVANGTIRDWFIYAVRDDDLISIIKQVVVPPKDAANYQAQLFHTLNSLLYRLDEQRPFRIFTDVDSFSVESDNTLVSVATDNITAIIAYAEDGSAIHHTIVLNHLYRGEFVQWLTENARFTGDTTAQLSSGNAPSPRTVFATISAPFQRTDKEEVGFENFLHYLDKNLLYPQVQVAFNGQLSAYTLEDWDSEIPHTPITITLTNLTRGYVTGVVKITPARVGGVWSRHAWLSFTHYRPAATTSPIVLTVPFTINGNVSTTIPLYLSHFMDLQRNHRYQQDIVLEVFDNSPTTPQPPKGYLAQFPIQLKLMPLIAGYRGKLWWQGLRGGLPGLLLDGGIGLGVGFVVWLLGTIFTPHTTWGLLPLGQVFTGSLNWATVIDGLLTGLLRPFYLAIASFGLLVPLFMGVTFGLIGFFTGWRKGHTQYSAEQDTLRHRSLRRLLVLVVAGMGIWSQAAPLTYSHLATIRWLHPLFPTNLGLLRHIATTQQMYVTTQLLAVILPIIPIIVANRIINRQRQARYRAVSEQHGQLLKPVGGAMS